MTVNEMRDALINRYSATIRGQRVEWMPESQVVAIYHSLVERKDLDSGKTRIPKKQRLFEPVKYEQIRMDI